jgi:hypothetical protein
MMNSSANQHSMRGFDFLARAGEEYVNEIIGIAQSERRPHRAFIRIVHYHFAF